jgi:hypothetical protein
MTGAYPKPVLLRSSWHRFVEQKGLTPEDRVVFFMERDEVNDMVRRYTVRAQRKVMTLMGKMFGSMSSIFPYMVFEEFDI